MIPPDQVRPSARRPARPYAPWRDDGLPDIGSRARASRTIRCWAPSRADSTQSRYVAPPARGCVRWPTA